LLIVSPLFATSEKYNPLLSNKSTNSFNWRYIYC